MKKTYIIPQLHVMQISCESLIAESFTKNASGADEGVVLVKGESSSRSNYNVWDDDWSAE